MNYRKTKFVRKPRHAFDYPALLEMHAALNSLLNMRTSSGDPVIYSDSNAVIPVASAAQAAQQGGRHLGPGWVENSDPELSFPRGVYLRFDFVSYIVYGIGEHELQKALFMFAWSGPDPTDEFNSGPVAQIRDSGILGINLIPTASEWYLLSYTCLSDPIDLDGVRQQVVPYGVTGEPFQALLDNYPNQ